MSGSIGASGACRAHVTRLRGFADHWAPVTWLRCTPNREVFFTDERLGSRDHPDSTFAAYDKLVFSRVRLPAWQIHSPSLQLEAPVSEKLADEAAADYEAQLMKCFPESSAPNQS